MEHDAEDPNDAGSISPGEDFSKCTQVVKTPLQGNATTKEKQLEETLPGEALSFDSDDLALI
eukprot:10050121-Ditylum_brightwellii.AAC.1